MTADWTTCRVVRQEDAGLFFRTEDALVNAGGPTWRAQDGEPWTTRDLCELLPLSPVLEADGRPVVTTVGDLTARHIGKRVRIDDHYDAKLETIFAHEGGKVALNFTHAEGFTYGCSRTIDTPCEVLP